MYWKCTFVTPSSVQCNNVTAADMLLSFRIPCLIILLQVLLNQQRERTLINSETTASVSNQKHIFT